MKTAIAAILLAAATSAQAAFWTGNDLLTRLQSSDVYDRAIGLGYVLGAFDKQQENTHCANGRITAGQLRDLVIKDLSNLPQHRHLVASELLQVIFAFHWPCQDRQAPQRFKPST